MGRQLTGERNGLGVAQLGSRDFERYVAALGTTVVWRYEHRITSVRALFLMIDGVATCLGSLLPLGLLQFARTWAKNYCSPTCGAPRKRREGGRRRGTRLMRELIYDNDGVEISEDEARQVMLGTAEATP